MEGPDERARHPHVKDDLPVFLYEKSASAPHRENLAKVRKGQFEGMAEKVKDNEWIPDFGGQRIHPTGSVIGIAARPPLIAYNINLGTDNLEIASEISKVIRQSGGGLDCVKAIGVMLEERNVAQVSVNMNLIALDSAFTLAAKRGGRRAPSCLPTSTRPGS